jgi:hypothetical protein
LPLDLAFGQLIHNRLGSSAMCGAGL